MSTRKTLAKAGPTGMQKGNWLLQHQGYFIVKVSCPKCGTAYRIPATEVDDGAVRIVCDDEHRGCGLERTMPLQGWDKYGVTVT